MDESVQSIIANRTGQIGNPANTGKETSCYVCHKRLKNMDVKMVLSSKSFLATNLAVEDRIVCGNCYFTIAKRNANRTRSISRAPRYRQRDVYSGMIKETRVNR